MFAILLACGSSPSESPNVEAADRYDVTLPSDVSLGEQVSASVSYTWIEGCWRSHSVLSEPSPGEYVLSIDREQRPGSCSEQTGSNTVSFATLRPGPSSFKVVIDGQERLARQFEVAASPPITEDGEQFALDLDDDTRWKLLAALLPQDEDQEPPPDASGTWRADSHTEVRERQDPGYVTTWSDGRVDWERFGPGESATRVQLCLLTVRGPDRAALERGPYCEPIRAWSPETSITIGSVVHTKVEP